MSSGSIRCVYLHGFASGPSSAKARFFRERLAARGIACDVVDLAPDFERTTVSDQLARALAAIGTSPCVLIGSSLGGYLASLAAAGPAVAQVEKLLLLAPAFRLHERWRERMSRAEQEQWEREGVLLFDHHVTRRKEPLRHEFLVDAARHAPLPPVTQPVLAFAGEHDDLVPPSVVREFCDAAPRRELVLVDDGHELTRSLESIWSRAEPWLTASGSTG